MTGVIVFAFPACLAALAASASFFRASSLHAARNGVDTAGGGTPPLPPPRREAGRGKERSAQAGGDPRGGGGQTAPPDGEAPAEARGGPASGPSRTAPAGREAAGGPGAISMPPAGPAGPRTAPDPAGSDGDIERLGGALRDMALDRPRRPPAPAARLGIEWLYAFGIAHEEAGEHAEAAMHYAEAAARLAGLRGPRHPETLAAEEDLARCLFRVPGSGRAATAARKVAERLKKEVAEAGGGTGASGAGLAAARALLERHFASRCVRAVRGAAGGKGRAGGCGGRAAGDGAVKGKGPGDPVPPAGG